MSFGRAKTEVRFAACGSDLKEGLLEDGRLQDAGAAASPSPPSSSTVAGTPKLDGPTDKSSRSPGVWSNQSEASTMGPEMTHRKSGRLPRAKSINDVLRNKFRAKLGFEIQYETESQRQLFQPRAHRVPGLWMWFIVLLTAFGIASINFFSLLVIEYCMRWKFGLMQHYIDNFGVLYGVLVLISISVGFAACGISIIMLFAPNAGGSGLPECKCYLNGSPPQRSFFTWRNLFARIFTSIFANAASFPVGREGPTVTIGTNLAYLISHKLTMPFVDYCVELRRDVSTFIVEEERFAHATRINCAVGGACAMAMLFNSPIGGLMYMFEEISPASWPLELTFRAFVATTLCTLGSYYLLSVVNKEIRDFVIFAWLPQNKEWTAKDIPIFVLLSAFLGVVTSYHTRMMLAVADMRKNWQGKWGKWKNFGVVAETLAYCTFCVSLAGAVSMFGNCRDIGTSGLQYVNFNCPEGQYNPVASLLVTTSHSSVKLLFSGANEGELMYPSSAIAFVTYFLLNVCLAGLPVPGGAFTATMLLGGLFGRSLGGFLRTCGYDTAVSGVYAVVGASAMLCGFKQMAAAVVLIVVQCVNDFNVTPIVMLSVSVALLVNRAINERGHDEEQIERKQLPFLEPEVPPGLDSRFAGDLMETDIPQLTPHDTIESLLEILRDPTTESITEFPILDRQRRRCIGTITRAHLSAGLQAMMRAMPSAAATDRFGLSREAEAESKVRRADHLVLARVNSGLHSPIHRASSGLALNTPVSDSLMPLDKIMDPTPFTIGEDMPAARFYALFGKAGENVAIVASRETGDFLGVITRKGLIKAAREHCH